MALLFPMPFERLLEIRKYYQEAEPKIIEAAQKSVFHWYNVYPFDWPIYFTPIEMDAWISIRQKGVVLYPQYPVLNYFVDFGNPFLKIALELDGLAFHKDKEKDRQRDQMLKDEGWKVYRVTGSEAGKTNYFNLSECMEMGLDERDTCENVTIWIMETGDGVVEAIRQIYFPRRKSEKWITDLCDESLRAHCLLNKTVFNGKK